MRLYNAVAELDTYRDPDYDAVTIALADYHACIGRTSPRGRPEVVLTVPADSLRQAVSTTLAVIEAAAGHPVLVVEAMPTTEFDARQGFTDVPELLSVTEAAAALDVSRTRVQQLIDTHQLDAHKVGPTWAITASSVTARRAHQTTTRS